MLRNSSTSMSPSPLASSPSAAGAAEASAAAATNDLGGAARAAFHLPIFWCCLRFLMAV